MNMQHGNSKTTSVEILREPKDEILRSIAKKHGPIADKVFRGLKNTIQRAQSYTGYFCVILRYDNNDVIGCANFIQNSKDYTQWFYTDLWVAPEYRRCGKAKDMIIAGCNHLSDIGAKTLLCTVDPNNEPSIRIQLSLGFKKIKTEPFEFFETYNLLMFMKEL